MAKRKSEFALGVWTGRQELAKDIMAIALMNDAEATKRKVKDLAERIINTET